MKVLNVRLSPEDSIKADVLRDRGVQISTLVRRAIDDEYRRTRPAPVRTAEEFRALIERVNAEHPDPPDLPPRDYDVHDRHEAAEAIRRHLRRKRDGVPTSPDGDADDVDPKPERS